MKKLAVIFSVVTTLLVACTKEKSIEGGVKQKLLVKTVAKLGSDSLVNSFSYDASARLTSYNTEIHFQGDTYQSQVQFIRSNDGIIQQVAITDNQSNNNNYTLNYSSGDTRYTSAVSEYSVGGQTVKDSIAFTYDATGQITRAEQFYDDGVSGGYAEDSKTEYAYDGDGNVIKATHYVYDSQVGTYNESEENTYEYDTKVNPLKLGIEAYIVNKPERASSYNITKVTTTGSNTITYTYTYNSENKPDTVTVLYQGMSVPFTGAYYYQ